MDVEIREQRDHADKWMSRSIAREPSRRSAVEMREITDVE
jgi:hypothetical protein